MAEKPSPVGRWLAGSAWLSLTDILGWEFLEADLIRLLLPCSVLIRQENKALVESLFTIQTKQCQRCYKAEGRPQGGGRQWCLGT